MMKYSAVDFGLLVENLTDGIVVMDMSRLIIEYINPAAKSLLAITSNDTHAPILPSMIFIKTKACPVRFAKITRQL